MRLEALGQQSEDGIIFIFFFVSEPIEQFYDVRGIAGLDQVRAQREIGIQGIGLGHDEQVTTFGQLQGHARERFEMPGLARADFARSLGNGAHFAALARIQRQDAVGLTPVGMTEDDGFDTEGTGFSHKKIIASKTRKNGDLLLARS